MALGEAAAPAASLTHLLGRLDVIHDRVRRSVAWRRTADPNPDDGFRGLYVSDQDVERILDGRASPAPPSQETRDRLAVIEAAADRAEAAGAEIRLRRLSREFDLDDLDLELLLIALAPDLDAGFERLYGYLNDDVSRRRASIGLGLELAAVSTAVAEARGRLSPSGTLVARRLLHVDDDDRPFLTRALRVPDRVAAFLLGGNTPHPIVARLTYACPPQPTPRLDIVARALAQGAELVFVAEPPGTSAAPMIAAAFGDAGLGALAVDAERIRPDDDLPALAGIIAREARLLGAGVVVGPIESLVARGATAVWAFTELPVTIALTGSRSWDPAWSRRVPLVTHAPLLSAEQRTEAWRHALLGGDAPGLDPVEATAGFRLTAGQVERAAASARLQAGAVGRPLAPGDLRAGARAQNGGGLERLARRIEPAVTFSDLVLPAATLEDLGDLMVRSRQRETVLDAWGMGGSARRRGLAGLFAGPSGTGKTMAAEVVAGALGFDLYTIDLATVVDKYIGETEKNLDRIFVEAERVNGVLLFDEADALFSKRTDVGDAHDRYANLEIAYLLQRMEMFDGIAILATNLRANLDEAFARRLDVVIDFPEPDEVHRLALWERCLGPLVPRADDIDLDFLARAFRLSGGGIRNIAVAAAFAAADERRALTMADLVRATQREYRKLGRLIVATEFGSYFAMLGQS